jgi:hypothetical protein
MKKLFLGLGLFITSLAAQAQVISGSSLFSPSAGGARILSAQGNTAANPAIGFQSSVSTTALAQNDGAGGNGIFRPLANTMAFATVGLERMRLTPGGNLGIGTSTPTSRLHVVGSQYLQNGSLTIGIAAPSHTSHLLHVNNGNIMISGTSPGFGGPMILFSDNVSASAYPNGRWGIEYWAGTGLNFWQPWNPSTGGGGNYFMLLRDDGKVGIGVDPTSCGNAFPNGYRLFVKEGILTEKVKVAVACSANWADYVFNNDYELKPLAEVETFINENKHLPGIPSASKLTEDGLDLGAMMSKQMEKIEELTLYMIKMDKELNQLKAENAALKNSETTK